MKDLKGRVAVVTGAASGIGLALAEELAAEGMKLVLADVEAEALAAAERSIRAIGGTPTLAIPTDVSRLAEVETLAERAMEEFGEVNVVCNNAGVAGGLGATWELSDHDWRWTLDVNLWGVIHGVRAFVPRMLSGGAEGHIVNTASMAGWLTLPYMAPYHVTKFAVVALSEALYYELRVAGSRIGASVLCPGFVRTAIMSSERNRPSTLAERAESEAGKVLRAAYDGLVDAGTSPVDCAKMVVDAIRSARFYVFPHPETLASLEVRVQRALAGRNPALDVVPETRDILGFLEPIFAEEP